MHSRQEAFECWGNLGFRWYPWFQRQWRTRTQSGLYASSELIWFLWCKYGNFSKIAQINKNCQKKLGIFHTQRVVWINIISMISIVITISFSIVIFVLIAYLCMNRISFFNNDLICIRIAFLLNEQNELVGFNWRKIANIIWFVFFNDRWIPEIWPIFRAGNWKQTTNMMIFVGWISWIQKISNEILFSQHFSSNFYFSNNSCLIQYLRK